MWFIITPLVKACISGIVATAFGKWFSSTKAGIWLQKKLDTFMEYLSNKYRIEILKKEERWKKEHPSLCNDLESLKKRLDKLEGK